VIQVTKLDARSFDLDHIDLFWEISQLAGPGADDVQHEIYDYQFFVLRSEAMHGPYTQIAGPLRDQYRLRDVQVSTLHGWRDTYYKVKVKHVPTGEEQEFGPVSYSMPAPDLVGAAIIYEEDVLFREFIGRKCWLFPKRTFGPRCNCFDIHLGQRTRSGHKPCFDTGFLGGYLSPVEVFPQIDPPGKAPQATSLGEWAPGDTAARMICFPPVHPKDILVESENVRWRVIKVTTTQRLRTTIRQELTLHEIPKGDVEYDLPINVDISKVVPAAERNFTNPSSVKNDGDFSDVFDFWAGKARGALR
jgi:hypothetical protein